MKPKWCELGDIAEVSMGFKSLQNQFFYLSAETIEHYKIEEEFLRPILRMKDFDANCFLQNVKPGEYFFYCTEALADIKGTGALRYIRAMEGRPAKQKKQSGKPKTISQVLKAQSGIYWYSPKAKLHEEHIWIRKAFNSIYAPFLFKKAVAVDQRCNYVCPKEKVNWEIIAAILSSSIFAFSVESAGTTSMGAGALEVATTMLHQIRVPDIRLFSEAQKQELVGLARKVWKDSKPIDWSVCDNPNQNIRKFDEWFLHRMNTSVNLERLYEDLKSTYEIRNRLARDKVTTFKESESQNVESVAKTIETAVRPILEGKRFPESFYPSTSEAYILDFSRYPKLIVRCEPFISNSSVVITEPKSGNLLVEKDYPRPVTEIILRALMMGRRKFKIPKDQEIANSVLMEFQKWISAILDKILQECRESALGTRFEQRLYETTMRRLGLHVGLAELELFGEFIIDSDLSNNP